MIKEQKKVFVGASGGVDSSTALALLKEQGYAVTGVFIKVWQPDFIVCQWKEDRLDAMRVCATLGVEFLDLDLEKEYKRDVFDYMIKEYQQGKTPNPDVMCNKKIKFGAFFDFAMKKGADYLATGHYVQRREQELLMGVDKNKDQSYFLWTLTQAQLKQCLFPIGQYEKTTVRQLAKKFGLPTAQKKDSQGLCFVGKVEMKDFLKRFISPQEGVVLNSTGEVIGKHEGVFYYTIGQRHGFEITRKGTADKPYYITAKDLKNNTLTVANLETQIQELRQNNFLEGQTGEMLIEIKEINWISGQKPSFNKKYQARVRYRQPLQDCHLQENDGAVFVKFDQPQQMDSGQSVVLYDGEICLGGGVMI